VKQLHPDPRLQARDRPADAGRRQAKDFRGTGEVAGFDDGRLWPSTAVGFSSDDLEKPAQRFG
jgi:hypothetical protein